MPHVIALLRAVNVGGTGKVAMADLKAMVAELGYGNPRTLLNSGNLVFAGDGSPLAKIEARLEAEALQRLGLKSDFILRTPQELRAVIARNPFPEMAQKDPTNLHVGFARTAPSAEAIAMLEAATTGLAERLEVIGREIYIAYPPEGSGRSKLATAMVKIERKHPSQTTSRNWNTVLKIAALVAE